MSFQFLRINDIRIGTKLAIGFSLVLSILVILSAIGVARVGKIKKYALTVQPIIRPAL